MAKAYPKKIVLQIPNVQASTAIWNCPTTGLPIASPLDHIPDMVTMPLQPVVSTIDTQVSVLRKLVKSSGIYALASIIPPLVSFGLAPYLTRQLSPADYGALTLLNTFISLAAGVTQLGLGSAFFRAYSYDYTTEDDRRAVLSTATALLCLVSILTMLVVILMASSLAQLLLGRSSFRNLIIISAGVVALQNIAVPAFAWLRAESRAFFYSLLAIGNLLITLVANIVLVGAFSLGILGSLLATGSGYICVTLFVIHLCFLRKGMKIRMDIARSMLAFGVPLVFNVISYWALQVLDRYLLRLFGSLAQTAEYAVAYTLGSALSIIVISPFGLAWPTVMFSVAKRKDALQLFQRLFRWMSMCLLLAAFALSLAATILLNWLFPLAYHSAAAIIPVVSLSFVFYGAYYIFVVGINVQRKTWMISIFSTIAAIINLALNLVLIPRFGAMGAATSTLFAYVALAIVAYIVNQLIYPISFEIGKFMLAMLLGIGLYLGSSFLTQSQPALIAWSISFGALGLYTGLLVVLGMLPTWMHKMKAREAKRSSYDETSYSSSARKKQSDMPSPIRVCMHVRGAARTDARVMREATALVAAGFAVTIVDIEQDATRPAQEYVSGVCIKHNFLAGSFTSAGLKLWIFFKMLWSRVYSAYQLMKLPADIYHAHDVAALPASYLAAQLRGKPLIFDSHELPLCDLVGSPYERYKKLFAWMLATSIPRFAGVITVSPPIVQEIRRRYHARNMALIRNMHALQVVAKTDCLRQFLGLGQEVRIALYQGNLQPNRGLDLLVRSAGFLEPNIMLVMMGKGIQTTSYELQTLIDSQGVADRVKIIPPVCYAELLEWTASADIGLALFPPDSSDNIRMCLPNKLFEYLMAGLPVLSSQLEAVVTILRAYSVGQVVSSLAPADIATAINKLLADRVALETMQRNALAAAHTELNWEKESQQLIRFYNDIMGRASISQPVRTQQLVNERE